MISENFRCVSKSDVVRMYGEGCILSGEDFYNLVKEICSEREEIARLSKSNDLTSSSIEDLNKLNNAYKRNLNKVVKNFTQYAASISNKQKFYDSQLTRTDLFQASLEGVCKALEKVDLSKCNSKTIKGFFMSHMRYAMCDELRDSCNQFMASSKKFKKSIRKVYAETDVINKDLGYDKSSSEYLDLLLTNAELYGFKSEDVKNYHLGNTLLTNNVNCNNNDKNEEEVLPKNLGLRAKAKQYRTVEDESRSTDARRNFWKKIDAILPKGYTEILYRVYVVGKKEKDIAIDYGVTAQAIHNRIKRAFTLIKRNYNYNDFDVEAFDSYDNNGWLVDK